MTEREIVAGLSEQLAEAQDKAQKAQAASNKLSHKLNIAEHEYKDLNGAYGRVCEKLAEVNTDLLNHKQYKRQYRALVATVFFIGIIVILGLALWSVV